MSSTALGICHSSLLLFQTLPTWSNLLLSLLLPGLLMNNLGSPLTLVPCHSLNFLDPLSLLRLSPLPGLPFLHTVPWECVSISLSGITCLTQESVILSINKAGWTKRLCPLPLGEGVQLLPLDGQTDMSLVTLSFVWVRKREK